MRQLSNMDRLMRKNGIFLYAETDNLDLIQNILVELHCKPIDKSYIRNTNHTDFIGVSVPERPPVFYDNSGSKINFTPGYGILSHCDQHVECSTAQDITDKLKAEGIRVAILDYDKKLDPGTAWLIE